MFVKLKKQKLRGLLKPYDKVSQTFMLSLIDC